MNTEKEIKYLCPGFKTDYGKLKYCNSNARFESFINYKSEIWLTDNGNLVRFVWFDNLNSYKIVEVVSND